MVFSPLWHQRTNDYNSYLFTLEVSEALYLALIFTEPHAESQNFEDFEESFQFLDAAVLFWKWGKRGSGACWYSDLPWEYFSYLVPGF